jgi:NDP-sugar pyrophosphorylase family protein
MPRITLNARLKLDWDTSNVEVVEGEILCYDKENRTVRMEFIDYGLGLFQPYVFASLAEGQPADLVAIYQNLVTNHNLSAYEVKQRFYEIGSFEGLRELDGLLTSDPDQFLRKEIP